MKKISNILWGIVLVVFGVLLALKAFDVIEFTLFFRGWWTLFIIVPCFIGLFSGENLFGNIAGIILGVLLLLSANGIFSFSIIWKLALPAIIIFVGAKMIFGNFFRTKMNAASQKLNASGVKIPEYCATFSGKKLNFNGQPFNGAEINSVFGGVDCDLRGAIIEGDVVINVSTVFGGVKFILPDNANLKVYSNSVFGSVDNKRTRPFTEGEPTIYINASCVFGGVDII